LDTSKELSDDKIVEIATRMYLEFGFRGIVGWHYYNEPLMAKERIIKLSHEIIRRVPRARFVLWTNGELIRPEWKELGIFHEIRVTNYSHRNWDFLKELVPSVTVNNWELDGRLELGGQESSDRCMRMFSEFIVDFYGNVHICCMDWKGEVKMGNVYTAPLEQIVEKFSVDRRTMMNGMTLSTPSFCRRCSIREKDLVAFVPWLESDIREYLSKNPNRLAENSDFNLAIVCAPCFGSPSPQWIAHHSLYSSHLLSARSEKEITEKLKEAEQFGARWGIVLNPDEYLVSNCENAPSIPSDKSNPNILLVGDSSEGREKSLIRLSEFDEYWRGYSFPKNVKGRVDRQRKTLDFPASGEIKGVSVKSKDCSTGRKTAVVFTHYRMPIERLNEHFIWNDKFYKDSGVSVFVVSDRQVDVPSYARCLVYPEELSVFNLSATSNYGIRFAVDCGYEVVVKTDVDILFTSAAWNRLLSVDEYRVVAPMYRMAQSYEERDTKYMKDGCAAGTVSMIVSNWRETHYHEECVGYGEEDWVFIGAAEKNGLLVDSAGGCFVWHIAHKKDGHPEKGTRVDAWNRDGFNPDNIERNKVFRDNPVYGRRDWGIPGWNEVTFLIDARENPERLEEFAKANNDRLNRSRVVATVAEEFDGSKWGIRCVVGKKVVCPFDAGSHYFVLGADGEERIEDFDKL
jgi:radical SAM protein with 4Fe4S-binding SPASM domain